MTSLTTAGPEAPAAPTLHLDTRAIREAVFRLKAQARTAAVVGRLLANSTPGADQEQRWQQYQDELARCGALRRDLAQAVRDANPTATTAQIQDAVDSLD